MKKYDFSQIAKSTDERIARGILPGAAMCVNINGKREYEYIAGFSDVENRVPLCRDALFRLCSMTKPITAAAALIACDRGLLDIRDCVKKYLPQFASRKVGCIEDGKAVFCRDAARDITIEDILTHSSGLGSGEVGDLQLKDLRRDKYVLPRDIVEEFSKMYLDFSPGESQMYSALAAMEIVVRIIEIIGGESYGDFVQKNIFDPLDMQDTGYVLTPDRKARLVPLYKLSDSADSISLTDVKTAHEGYAENCVSGVTGLIGSMDDYSKFAEMLCGGGQYRGVRVLSEKAVEKMRTPHFPFGFAGMNEFFDWGYGVRVCSAKKSGVQELTPGSFGWSGAYSTHFWVDPVRKVTAVYMANLDNAGGAGAATGFEFERNVMRALENA